MKAVVTRVSSASVKVDEVIIGKIEKGFLVLLGIDEEDTEKELNELAEKICGVRIFSDAQGKMNLDLKQVNGKLLVVSQFTLCADVSHGRRPSFSKAMKPDKAKEFYEKFLEICHSKGFETEHGIFGADMKVESVNDGPVTLLFDTKELKK